MELYHIQSFDDFINENYLNESLKVGDTVSFKGADNAKIVEISNKPIEYYIKKYKNFPKGNDEKHYKLSLNYYDEIVVVQYEDGVYNLFPLEKFDKKGIYTNESENLNEELQRPSLLDKDIDGESKNIFKKFKIKYKSEYVDELKKLRDFVEDTASKTKKAPSDTLQFDVVDISAKVYDLMSSTEISDFVDLANWWLLGYSLPSYIKESEHIDEGQYASYALKVFKKRPLFLDNLEDADIKEIEKIISKSADKYKDQGSYVSGHSLRVNGEQILTNWTQGNMGFEFAAEEIKNFIESKYPKLKVSIEYGNMM